MQQTLFADMDAVLAQAGALSLKNLFIDGTKIESVANKYTFVWKKSVTKRQAKVLAAIPGFILQTQELFGIQVLHTHAVHRYHLRRLLGKLKRLQRKGHVVFVHAKAIVRRNYKRQWKKPSISCIRQKSMPSSFITAGTGTAMPRPISMPPSCI